MEQEEGEGWSRRRVRDGAGGGVRGWSRRRGEEMEQEEE